MKNMVIMDSNEDEQQIGIMSSSSSIVLTDGIYYNASTGKYLFRGNWNWINDTWDAWAGPEDIAAVRFIERPSRIEMSMGATFNQNGVETNNISKRHEEANGVAYNVIDKLGKYPNSTPFYYTDNGYIIVGFTDNTYNKIFLDFEHNYKATSFSASITITGLDIREWGLHVSYSGSIQKWRRTSPGEIIN